MRYRNRLLAMLLMVCFLLRGIFLCVAAEEVSLYMDVAQPGQKSASFSVGQRHKWFIRMKVPDNWADISGVTILQTLSPALTLDTESLCVRLVQQSGEEILLRMEEHYLLTAGSVFVEDGTADRLCISLTREGMAFLSAYQESSSELMVSYIAKINTSASMGTQILGMAQLNQTNSEGRKCIYLSDKAVTATGGFHILLTNTTGEPLSDGSFMLAREATQKEIEDSSVLKELLDIGDETIAVIYERFYAAEDLSGEKADMAVTDENGAAACYGLAYGTYYLVQTESVREDMLPAKPVGVRVDEASHLTAADGWKDSNGRLADRTVRVINNTMLAMPQTGGPGTAAYTASGTAVILCACLLLWYNRKRRTAV